MTSQQHAQKWEEIRAGFKPALFVLPSHALTPEQRRQRENKYTHAQNSAPKCNKISRRTSKKPGSGFSRGMYWNVSRGYATDGYRHMDNRAPKALKG